MTSTNPRPLCVLAADEDAARLDGLAGTLRSLGHDVTPYAVRTDQVADIVGASDPDLAIVAVHEDDEHALELIDEISECASGPVLVTIESENADFVARAAEHGIFAYVHATNAEAIQSAIEVAVHRHADLEALSGQVGRLESAIERRAIIERAKGILMERHAIDHRPAFELLRKRARETNARVIDLARHVVESRGL